MSLSDRWHDFWDDYWYKRWTGRDVGDGGYEATVHKLGPDGGSGPGLESKIGSDGDPGMDGGRDDGGPDSESGSGSDSGTGRIPEAEPEPGINSETDSEPVDSATQHGRRWRLSRVVAAAAAALILLIGLVVFLPLAFDESDSTPDSGGAAPERAATPQEAQAALRAAATALRARDHDAFRAALSARGPAARAAVDDLYRRLAPLPWTAFTFVAEPVAAQAGRYDLTAAGQLGRVGPPDRVAALRRLDLRLSGGRVVVTGDATPLADRSRYLMAFDDPIAVRRNGLLVLADRGLAGAAGRLADAGAAARPALARVGVAAQEPVLVSLYASREQLRAALAGGPSERRITFFSGAAPRLADTPWRTRDIGVLAPALAKADAEAATPGADSWTPHMLAHELTHAFTARWFAGTEHAPLLLLEGLATYVEGGRSYAPLKSSLGSGDSRWPLPKTLATADLWKGNTSDDVELAYLEGASLVSYVVDQWGRAKLRPFLVALAGSDLTTAGVGAATQKTLGVRWKEFLNGWREYVQTLD